MSGAGTSETGTARIVLDRSRCSGIGICESLAESHFEVGDDGNLVVLRDEVADGELGLLRQVCSSCPTGALSLVESPS